MPDAYEAAPAEVEEPDSALVDGTNTDDEWVPYLKREAIQTAVAIGAYLLIKLAIDLYDEESVIRWRIRRYWHRAMTAISSDEENKLIATTAARGIEYAQIWLNRHWADQRGR